MVSARCSTLGETFQHRKPPYVSLPCILTKYLKISPLPIYLTASRGNLNGRRMGLSYTPLPMSRPGACCAVCPPKGIHIEAWQAEASHPGQYERCAQAWQADPASRTAFQREVNPSQSPFWGFGTLWTEGKLNSHCSFDILQHQINWPPLSCWLKSTSKQEWHLNASKDFIPAVSVEVTVESSIPRPSWEASSRFAILSFLWN